MCFVCQGLNNTIYGSKKPCCYWEAFRSQLRPDNEFWLNLWNAVIVYRGVSVVQILSNRENQI